MKKLQNKQQNKNTDVLQTAATAANAKKSAGSFTRIIIAFLLMATLAIVAVFVGLISPQTNAHAMPSTPEFTVSTHFRGQGTACNPFLISNRTDMDRLAMVISQTGQMRWNIYRRPAAHFALTQNIAMGGGANQWINTIGRRANTVGTVAPYTTAAPFRGVFDGRGHTINGLNILYADARQDWGLFGYTQDATIRNLTIATPNVTFTGDNVSYVGSLLAFAGVNTRIENVRVTSGIMNVMAATRVGGLVGASLGSSNTVHNVIFGSSYSGTIMAGRYLGGLIGRADRTRVVQSYSTGSVSSDVPTALIGGLVGWMSRVTRTANNPNTYAILNSFTTSSITTQSTTAGADFAVGGLLGHSAYGLGIRNSYASGTILVGAQNGTVRAAGLVGREAVLTNLIGNASLAPSLSQVGGTRQVGILSIASATTAAGRDMFAASIPLGFTFGRIGNFE